MTSRPAFLPDYATPADLADHFGMSERTMRDKLREFGCFSRIGRKWVLFPEHVENFKEALTCRSNSTGAGSSGTTEARLPEGNYERLQAQRTKQSQNGSKRKPRRKRGEVISMDRGRM